MPVAIYAADAHASALRRLAGPPTRSRRASRSRRRRSGSGSSSRSRRQQQEY